MAMDHSFAIVMSKLNAGDQQAAAEIFRRFVHRLVAPRQSTIRGPIPSRRSTPKTWSSRSTRVSSGGTTALRFRTLGLGQPVGLAGHDHRAANATIAMSSGEPRSATSPRNAARSRSDRRNLVDGDRSGTNPVPGHGPRRYSGTGHPPARAAPADHRRTDVAGLYRRRDRPPLRLLGTDGRPGDPANPRADAGDGSRRVRVLTIRSAGRSPTDLIGPENLDDAPG